MYKRILLWRADVYVQYYHRSFQATRLLDPGFQENTALEVVRQLALTMYDRDVLIDLSGIPGWNASDIIVLLAIDILLREAGHRLILQGVPGDLKTTLDTLGLAKTLTIHEAGQSSLSYTARN